MVADAVSRHDVVELPCEPLRGGDAAGDVVLEHVDDIFAACDHDVALLTARHEEVFDEPPVEECAGACDLFAREVGDLADLGERGLGGGDESVFGVEIDEDSDAVALLQSLCHVFGGHEDFAIGTAVEVTAEIDEARDGQIVVPSDLDALSVRVLYHAANVAV